MNSQTENGHGNMTEVGQLKGLGLETHLVTNSEVTLPTSLNGIAGSTQLPTSSIAGIISKYESLSMIHTCPSDKSDSLALIISRFFNQLKIFKIGSRPS